MKKIISAIKWSIVGLLAPVFAFAQGGLTVPNKPNGLPGYASDTISEVLRLYINLALAIVGLIAVGFLIYGGFQYITSAGNAEQSEAAKKTIQNSIIGLVVIILSYIIVAVIINSIGRNQV